MLRSRGLFIYLFYFILLICIYIPLHVTKTKMWCAYHNHVLVIVGVHEQLPEVELSSRNKFRIFSMHISKVVSNFYMVTLTLIQC